MEYDDALSRAKELVEERKPDASPQKKAAFANSVAYLVTGWSGGYGGPSVREHAACQMYGPGGTRSFEEAARLLLTSDGPIFGPITDLHRELWRDEDCFDDDLEDVKELEGNGR